MRVKKKIEIEYNWFEVGDRITSTSRYHCPFVYGVVYVVTQCIAPMSADDKCIVFVEGHTWGVSTEYFTEIRNEVL